MIAVVVVVCVDVVVAAYFLGTEDSQHDKEVCGSQVLSRHLDHKIFRLSGSEAVVRNLHIHHSYIYLNILKTTSNKYIPGPTPHLFCLTPNISGEGQGQLSDRELREGSAHHCCCSLVKHPPNTSPQTREKSTKNRNMWRLKFIYCARAASVSRPASRRPSRSKLDKSLYIK